MSHFKSLTVGCLALIMLVLSACGDSPDKEIKNNENAPPESKVKFDITPSRSVVKMNGELFNIPSPIQTITLLKNTEVDYDATLLSGIGRSSQMNNETIKALNLGALGVDLAYLSNFQKAQLSLSYLKELESLASDLDISENIDREILERFSENVGNKDSLYTLNSEFYRAGYRYLKENERNKASSLILLGGWVEAMHYAAKSADKNEKLRTRIIEQGRALKGLINLCSAVEEDEMTNKILAIMNKMDSRFDTLDRDYTYVEPITDRTDRRTYFNSLSSVIANDEQMNEFVQMIDEMRNLIIA